MQKKEIGAHRGATTMKDLILVAAILAITSTQMDFLVMMSMNANKPTAVASITAIIPLVATLVAAGMVIDQAVSVSLLASNV